MSLRQEQTLFLYDLTAVIYFAYKQGFDIVLGEAQRPIEMQRIYVETGRSRTLDSYHIRKLAADLFFFKQTTGELTYDRALLLPIGTFWESLSPKNSWGGNWNSFKDLVHFERRA